MSSILKPWKARYAIRTRDPTGTKLYFGKTAKIKRNIEAVASDVLYEAGYEELITPLFFLPPHLIIAQ